MPDYNRLQKRITKNLLAKIMLPTMEFFGYVQDLAKTGVGFTCNRKVEVGTEVKLQVNIPKQPTMTLAGKVVWRRDLPTLSKNKYQVGMTLTQFSAEYEKYVELQLKREYERREHTRYADMLEVHNEDVIDLLDAAVADVSASGLYIRTGKPLPIGQQFEMALNSKTLPRPLHCLAEVVASFETDPDDLDHPYGAGVKIISFASDDGTFFTDYLMTLEELYKFHWPEGLDLNAPPPPPPKAPRGEEDISID